MDRYIPDGPEERQFEHDEWMQHWDDALALEEQLGDEARELPENWT